jgi:hypothetical protein
MLVVVTFASRTRDPHDAGGLFGEFLAAVGEGKDGR